METELINCSSYLNDNLKYYVKLTIDVQVTKGQVYKENLHRNLYGVISRFKDDIQSRYILQAFNSIQEKDRKIEFTYRFLDSNIGYLESIQLEDNHFRIEYAEMSNNNLGILNLYNALTPYICLLEAIKVGQKDGALFKIKVCNTVESTMKSAFHPNAGPFPVRGIGTITYFIYDKPELFSDIENEDMVYEAIRRFYQQFKCEAICSLPYLELEKETFASAYATLWK